MPRSASDTREEILQAAFTHFRRKGFFRTGVDEIAAASRVTKRTLYNHFSSKDELLAAVLDAQHQRTFQAAEPYGSGVTGDPQRIVDTLFRKLVVWSSTPKWAGSGFTRLAMELADLPGHPARSIASRHKSFLEDYIARVLATAGLAQHKARARELILLLEGAMVLMMIHGDRGYVDAAADAARKLLARSDPSQLARKRPGAVTRSTKAKG